MVINAGRPARISSPLPSSFAEVELIEREVLTTRMTLRSFLSYPLVMLLKAELLEDKLTTSHSAALFTHSTRPCLYFLSFLSLACLTLSYFQ